MTPNAADEDVEKVELSYIAGGNLKMVQPLQKQFGSFYETKHVITIWPSNCIPEHLSERNEKSCLYKNLYRNVYNTFIQNSKIEQNKKSLDRNHLSFSEWMINKLADSYSRILFSNFKKHSLLIHATV